MYISSQKALDVAKEPVSSRVNGEIIRAGKKKVQLTPNLIVIAILKKKS